MVSRMLYMNHARGCAVDARSDIVQGELSVLADLILLGFQEVEQASSFAFSMFGLVPRRRARSRLSGLEWLATYVLLGDALVLGVVVSTTPRTLGLLNFAYGSVTLPYEFDAISHCLNEIKQVNSFALVDALCCSKLAALKSIILE